MGVVSVGCVVEAGARSTVSKDCSCTNKKGGRLNKLALDRVTGDVLVFDEVQCVAVSLVAPVDETAIARTCKFARLEDVDFVAFRPGAREGQLLVVACPNGFRSEIVLGVLVMPNGDIHIRVFVTQTFDHALGEPHLQGVLYINHIEIGCDARDGSVHDIYGHRRYLCSKYKLACTMVRMPCYYRKDM